MKTISIICARLVVAFAALFVATGADAQVRDWLTNNTLNNGSTVRDLIAAFDRAGATNPAYRDELKRLRANIGLVFVPGILGSSLESKTLGKIWGFGMPDADKLRLPRELIDPDADSDVEAKLADSVLTVDLYGAAMKMVRESAIAAGIPPARIIACGYDWRRDIRAGARDLKRCIETSPELSGVEALVIVAHSMGGLVTWQWHGDYAPKGRLAGGAQVIAVAVLGSPLAGSCEIVHMIETGYVQPTANDQYADQSWLKIFLKDAAGMKDRVVNAVSSKLTDSIRPAVLSWPGAIAITPPPAQTKDDVNCAPVPLHPEDGTDPSVLTHYDPAFWLAPIGKSLLNGALPPDTYTTVLPRAKDFRAAFKAETIASPTYLFASQIWDTPAQAKLSATFTVDHSAGWITVSGDGRVPFNAAMPTKIQLRAADATRVYSVHGNLPEDKIFHSEFFIQRLPRVREGWIATRLMNKAKDDPVFLKAYLAAGGHFANPRDLHAAYERQSPTNQRDPIYNITISAWNAAVDFNNALCELPGQCPDYARARQLAQGRPNAASAAIYSASIRGGSLNDDEHSRLMAKRGLAMARDQNWSAAIGDLRDAVPMLEDMRKRLGTKEPANQRELRINATANFGRALAIRGYCSEAAPYLRQTAASNAFAAQTLKAPCYDRESGKIVSLGR
jgi:hypothetical protein